MKRTYDDDDDENGEERRPEVPSPEDSPIETSQKESINDKIEALKTFLEEKYREFPGSENWTENYLYSDIKDEDEINALDDVAKSEILSKRHDAFRDIKQWKTELEEVTAEAHQPPPKKSKKSERSKKSEKHKKTRDYSSDEEEEEEEEFDDEDMDEEDDFYESDHSYDEDDDEEEDYEDSSSRRKSKKKEKKKSKKSKSKHHKHHKHSSDEEEEYEHKKSSKKNKYEEEYDFDEDDEDNRPRSPSPSKSDDENAAGYEERSKKKEGPKKGYPIEFKDIKHVQLRKKHVYENIRKPGFKDAVKGMFVKSNSIQGGNSVSKMLKITGVVTVDEYIYDSKYGERTNIAFLVKAPGEHQDYQLQVQYVSNQDITEAEFDIYKSAAERAGEPIIEKSVNKIISNYVFSLKKRFADKELEALSKRSNAMPDIYLKKDKIIRLLTALKDDNVDNKNDARIADLTKQLNDVCAQIDANERKKKEEKRKLEKRYATAAAQMGYRDPSLKAYKKALAIAMAGRKEDKPPQTNRFDIFNGVMTGKCSRDDLKKYYNFELDLDAPLKLRQPTLAYPVPALPPDAKVITLADYVSTHQ